LGPATGSPGAARCVLMREEVCQEDYEPWPFRSLRGYETVLVAEDDPLLLPFLSRVLELHGYEVLAAFDAVVALEATSGAAVKIDLLVADDRLQGISGPELARRLAAGGHDVPVIFMTGHRDEIHDESGCVVDAVLRKPFSARQFLEGVRAALDEAAESGT
jgi:DNA-binding response OmpR family regulator